MGVHIYAYAVDIPRFSEFLESSMAELICRYFRDGRDANEHFTSTYGDAPNSVVVFPNRSIKAAIEDEFGRHYLTLDEESVRKLPMLQLTAREHLSTNIYQAYWLLAAFANCHGVDFIENLIDGHRRWWIGSVLKLAHERFGAATYEELELLFRKILRGYDCGWKISLDDVGFTTDGLPFEPEIDPNERFGRWSGDEARTVATRLSSLLSEDAVFPNGSLPFRDKPNDVEWDAYVKQIVAALCRIAHLNYSELNVLTFIG